MCGVCQNWTIPQYGFVDRDWTRIEHATATKKIKMNWTEEFKKIYRMNIHQIWTNRSANLVSIYFVSVRVTFIIYGNRTLPKKLKCGNITFWFVTKVQFSIIFLVFFIARFQCVCDLIDNSIIS